MKRTFVGMLPGLIAGPALGLALGLVLGLGGCTGHSNYEPEDRASNIDDLPDPNQPNAERVVTASLKYVLDKYRPGNPDQPLAVNLPPGMHRSNYERIAGRVGPNVVPVTEEISSNNSMPIFHVGAVKLRGNNAKVDIYRPTTEIAPDPVTGKPVYQMITVTLQGGLQPWRPMHAQAREPGAFPVPPLYAIPAIEDWNHFENWKKAQREIAQAQERAALDQRIEQLPTRAGDKTASGTDEETPNK